MMMVMMMMKKRKVRTWSHEKEIVNRDQIWLSGPSRRCGCLTAVGAVAWRKRPRGSGLDFQAEGHLARSR